VCGCGGWVDARSHPGESFALVLRLAIGRFRRFLVRTTRCMTLPQKQVGSARFGARPIIRKRICAPQNRFGHSHHSSRLFFTNAASARFNAPRRCTDLSRAFNDAGQHFLPRVHVGLNGLLTIIWRCAHRLPGKRCCSLTIATVARAVGFHPKFWIYCGADVRPGFLHLDCRVCQNVGVFLYARSWSIRSVLALKQPNSASFPSLRDIHFYVISSAY
jgi:hypothetical protein